MAWEKTTAPKMSDETLMTATTEVGIEVRPEVAMVLEKQEAVLQLMQLAMHEGADRDYSVIPGCGPKPTLLQPGAQKLARMFDWISEYTPDADQIMANHEKYIDKDGHFTIFIGCRLVHAQAGTNQGHAMASASTRESKHLYRDAELLCPQCEKLGAIIKGRDDLGGGWLCWVKKGGCGAKWGDGDEVIEGQERGQIENPNPADQYNTVIQMAQKRAFVRAVRQRSACADIFAQDLEDLTANVQAAKVKATGFSGPGISETVEKTENPPYPLENLAPPAMTEDQLQRANTYLNLALGLIDNNPERSDQKMEDVVSVAEYLKAMIAPDCLYTHAGADRILVKAEQLLIPM